MELENKSEFNVRMLLCAIFAFLLLACKFVTGNILVTGEGVDTYITNIFDMFDEISMTFTVLNILEIITSAAVFVSFLIMVKHKAKGFKFFVVSLCGLGSVLVIMIFALLNLMGFELGYDLKYLSTLILEALLVIYAGVMCLLIYKRKQMELDTVLVLHRTFIIFFALAMLSTNNIYLMNSTYTTSTNFYVSIDVSGIIGTICEYIFISILFKQLRNKPYSFIEQETQE